MTMHQGPRHTPSLICRLQQQSQRPLRSLDNVKARLLKLGLPSEHVTVPHTDPLSVNILACLLLSFL